MIRKIVLAGLILIFSCGQVAYAGDAKRLDVTELVAQSKVAVGYYRDINNNLSPLSYTTINGGTTWSPSGVLPLPGGVAANGIQNSELQGIACDSTGRLCSAVGFYRNSSNNLAPLGYTTTNGGAAWLLSASFPMPSNVAAIGTQQSTIQGVTCASPGHLCRAVGYYRDNQNNLVPLSYSTANDGATWSLSTVLPLPSNVAANGIQNSKLQSISCDRTGRLCSAIGFYLNTNNNLVPLSYTTASGGVIWSISNSFPLPGDVATNGIQNSELQSVACGSAGIHCNAVGFYLNNNNNLAPLSYITGNGGVSWSLSSTLPLPGDVAANGIQTSKLQSVACDGAGIYCNAVGFYLNNNNNVVPLSYTTANGGVSWFLSNLLPVPNNVAANGIQKSELQGVSCDSSGIYCSAVGFYLNSSNNLAPLSYTTINGGVSWTLSTTLSLPSNVATIGNQKSVIYSVG